MVIGITGNLGAGKTTVADMFRRLGARIIDADRIAHTIMKPRSSAYKEIIAVFGRGILAGSYINRSRLAEMVFSDKKKLKKLNKITHPRILRIIKSRIKKLSDNETLVIDAPLLIESGLKSRVDRLIVVECDPEIQMRRLKERGLTANQIRARLSFQLPQSEKARFADFVIDNRGRRSRTEKQVREIWNSIKRGGEEWKR